MSNKPLTCLFDLQDALADVMPELGVQSGWRPALNALHAKLVALAHAERALKEGACPPGWHHIVCDQLQIDALRETNVALTARLAEMEKERDEWAERHSLEVARGANAIAKWTAAEQRGRAALAILKAISDDDDEGVVMFRDELLAALSAPPLVNNRPPDSSEVK
jgi:hypothetical protein